LYFCRDFTSENKKAVEKIIAKFPSNYKASAVMPLLTLAQEQNDNWLPIAAMNHIASLLEMPRIRVYEVATFYSMYNREKLGKYHIQLCGTTPCMLCGSQKLGEALEQHLGVKAGETTKDGLFTWTEVECLGACANAPMIQVNNHEFYENLTPETLTKLVDNLRSGKPLKVGPQNGQRVAEGIQGKTSLFEEPKAVCRDLNQVESAWKAELEKQKKEAEAKKAAAPAAPQK
jgi:NADH dehydrogenase (ubiquinone) flavoprotein 2